MSLQNTAQQLLQAEKRQIELESQIKEFQSALSKLQGEHWRKHFTNQLISIKAKADKRQKILEERQAENNKLKGERDSFQKQVDDLTVQLRESQKPKPEDDKKENKKENKKKDKKTKCGGQMNKSID